MTPPVPPLVVIPTGDHRDELRRLVRAAHVRAGLTYARVADALGVSVRQVTDLEHGRATLSDVDWRRALAILRRALEGTAP